MAAPDITNISVTLCEGPDALRSHAPAWQQLAQNAIEQNLHCEPDVLFALLSLTRPKGVQVAFFWDGDTLVGVWPLQEKRAIPIPVRQISTYYDSAHMMSCVPLIHAGYVEAVIAQLLTWVRETSGARLFSIDEVTCKSEIWSALKIEAKRQGFLEESVSQYQRPAMRDTTLSFADYLAAHTSGKRRNALKRKRKKIEALGEWSLRCAAPCLQSADGGPENLEFTDDWKAILADLIHVESLSWKASHGSALAENHDVAEFVTELCTYAYQTGRLYLIAAYVGDRPVAAQLGLVNDGEIMIYKLGHDESLKNHSPGLLLMHDIVNQVKHAKPALSLDSCADPKIRLYSEAMAEHRQISKLRFSPPSLSARSAHHSWMLMRDAAKALKKPIKTLKRAARVQTTPTWPNLKRNAF